MRQFITFVRKEFLHIFRDSRTMLILLGMPVVQMLLFGFAITTEVRNTKVAVFDPSQSMESRAIIERFNASKYFTIAEEIHEQSRINDIFKYGEVGLVIVFSDNFESELRNGGDAAVQLITDGTEPNQASMITGYASNILAQCVQELSVEGTVTCRIIPQIRMLYNPQAESAYNFVPGVMGMILMLICAMMTSIAIVREKENGTMEILLVSPMKPIYIILSKVTPYFTLSMINLITILLLSVYVLGVPIAGSLVLLLLVSIIFIFLALSLGLLISNIVNTQVAAMLVSGMGLMMPVMLLSGFMTPIDNMPLFFQKLAEINPLTYFFVLLRGTFLKSLDAATIMANLMPLIIMAVVTMTFSMWFFNKKLD